MGFPTNYKKRLQHQAFSSKHEIKRYAYCDDLGAPSLMHSRSIHIYKTGNTLTCTDDLNRLTNAHE